VWSPCVLSPLAQAGDKIEFSTPDASLEIPKADREEKEVIKPDFAPVPSDAVGPRSLPKLLQNLL